MHKCFYAVGHTSLHSPTPPLGGSHGMLNSRGAGPHAPVPSCSQSIHNSRPPAFCQTSVYYSALVFTLNMQPAATTTPHLLASDNVCNGSLTTCICFLMCRAACLSMVACQPCQQTGSCIFRTFLPRWEVADSDRYGQQPVGVGQGVASCG